MRDWIIEKWDHWVYRLAFHSIRRMCQSNGGFIYLLELWIRKWRSENPIPPELERSTEWFFESLSKEYSST